MFSFGSQGRVSLMEFVMKKLKFGTALTVVTLILFLLAGCGPRRIVTEKKPPVPPVPETKETEKEIRVVQYGIASWYGGEFHGRATSSGEIYDMYQLTCAHNSFQLGTMVMVTNLENGRSLELKVNDRGPFVKNRIIDISYAAAKMLDIWGKGTALVKVEGLGPLIEPVQFTLQIGSFVDELKAKELAAQLKREFETTSITTVETPTQTYYRVRVGQFETKEAAAETAEKLSRMGYKVLVTSR